ncbi:Exonuclease RNase T and DNA polymerase III [Actinobacteria bacterium OV450]|nr:Exonuclease RNase T and DNA polymerase III [Actinobacteria bacterium OV450]
MRSWTSAPWVAVDTETTGVNPETDRVVTAAVVKYHDGRAVGTRTWLSDAGGVPVQAGATAVHGMTTEFVQREGRPAALVIAEVVAALVEAAEAGWPIVVMNAPFDLTLLEREAERHGVRSLFSASAPLVLDPRILDKHEDRYRKGQRRLVDLCRTYGVVHQGAHDAAADAVAACAVTAAILRRYSWLAGMPLGELHEQQVRWAADLQGSLRAHFSETPGKQSRVATVRTDWPVIPAARSGWAR